MINMAMLLGRVGKKETKPIKNGGEVTLLSIATQKKWKDSTGAAQELTTWHNVNCFSKLAEIASKYIHVGDFVFIQGEIQNRKVESGERAGQYVYSVTASDIKFIPQGKKTETQAKPQATPQQKMVFQDDDVPYF